MTAGNFFLSLLMTLPLALQASQDTAVLESFTHELESIKYNISLKYAPAEWKSSYLNWDPETAYQEAQSNLKDNAPANTKGYQKIVHNFLGSTRDYHVRALFYSTASSAIPLKVKRVNGHYYISQNDFDFNAFWEALFFGMEEIDFDRMSKELDKCNIGDEVVAIDGVPVETVVEKLIDEELSGDRTPTGYALATRMLFMRYGRYGQELPTGSVTITLNQKKEKKPLTLTIPWLQVKEWVKEMQPKSFAPKPATFWQRLEKSIAKDYSVDIAKSYTKTLIDIRQPQAFADEEIDLREKGFLPPLGRIIWESDSSKALYAYIYKNNQGKRIGYLYIPHFNVYDTEAEELVNQTIEIVKRFNRETDGLVLDINDNPGGNFFYMLAILSLLTDTPMALPTQTEILIPKDVYEKASLYNELRLEKELAAELKENNLPDDQDNSLSGYNMNEEEVQKIMDYSLAIVNLWESGETTTPPLAMLGLDKVMPHPKVQYKKPILLLINEMDFSCGDLFPAILQDNDRALLFGKKTAGAGGYVMMYEATSRFGIAAYSLTGSLCKRVGGEVIENLGVTPDVPYELTKRDLEENYADYIRTVDDEVRKLINTRSR